MSWLKTTCTTVVKDRRKLDEIMAKAARLSRKEVAVGWLAPSQQHRRFGAGGQIVTDTRNTVVDVAAQHEFGDVARNLPRRPVLGTAVDMYRRDLGAKIASSAKAFIEGPLSEDALLTKLGAFWKERVQRTFTDTNGWAPLTPKYAARRLRHTPHTLPLLDTGHLRESVEYRVVSKGYGA